MLANLLFGDSQLMLLSLHINVIYFYDIDKLIKIAGVDLQWYQAVECTENVL